MTGLVGRKPQAPNSKPPEKLQVPNCRAKDAKRDGAAISGKRPECGVWNGERGVTRNEAESSATKRNDSPSPCFLSANWLPKPATSKIPHKRRSLRDSWCGEYGSSVFSETAGGQHFRVVLGFPEICGTNPDGPGRRLFRAEAPSANHQAASLSAGIGKAGSQTRPVERAKNFAN